MIDLDKRQLFKRVHDIWIQVSDREIGDEKDLCQQEALWINSFTVDGLLGVLSKETSYKKGQCQYQDDFTMLDNIGKLDNRCVPKLMLQWIRKIHHTHRKLQKKQSFLNMKDDILQRLLTVNHKILEDR